MRKTRPLRTRVLQADSMISPDASLLQASHSGDLEAVRTLLANGTSTNYVYCLGNLTALMCSSSRGDLNITIALLVHGADVTAINDQGETALLKAVRTRRHFATVALLLNFERYYESTICHGDALVDSLHHDDNDMLTTLLTHGANVNTRTVSDGDTVLLVATKDLRDNAVNVLLAHNAEVAVANEAGNTPLLHALGTETLSMSLLAHAMAITNLRL